MIKKFLYQIKKIFFFFRLDINKYNRLNHPHVFFHHLFKNSNIDCVIDLGAHVGEYHDMIRNLGYKKSIICIEPQKKISQILLKKTQKYKNTIVFSNLAIFNKNTNKRIFLYENTHTSSLKKYLKKKYEDSYFVKCITLDNLLKKKFLKKNNLFSLKLIPKDLRLIY